MPNLAIPRVVVDGTVFTQSQNDTQCSAVETLLNTTKLDSSNIQNGAVTTPLIASGAVTAGTIAAGAVGTSAIAANAVTGSLLNANVVDNSSIQLTANQLSVKPSGVTQAMLAPRATGSTVAAGGVATSSNVVSYTNLTTSFTTIASVTITTTGRPVLVALRASGATTTNVSEVFCTGSAGFIAIFRDSTFTNACYVCETNIALSSNFIQIDFPAAGTYTYSAQGKVSVNNGSNNINVQNYSLVAFEL